MYFDNCHTAQECKAHYRTLAKKLHPDKQGGTNTAFQAMQADYYARLHELKDKAPKNSKEATELARAILDILRITKPELYEAARLLGAIPTVGMLTTMLGNLFPDQSDTLNEIISLLH